MDMDDDGMRMTFASWSSYQLKIIFNSWNVTTRWEFVIAWICVFIFSIFYHWLRYILCQVENTYFKSRLVSDGSNAHFLSMGRFVHSIVNAMLYGSGLFMMLIAMTYNPCLFLSLVLGYATGDYLFFKL